MAFDRSEWGSDEQGTHTDVGFRDISFRDVQDEHLLIQLFGRIALYLEEATGIKGQAEPDKVLSLPSPSLPWVGDTK